MGRYAPGTLDDDAYLARSRRKRNRIASVSTTPTDSQIYGTSEVVETEFPKVKEMAEEALAKAEEALERAPKDYEFVDMTQDEIDAMFE